MKTKFSHAERLKVARTFRLEHQVTDVTVFDFLHSLDTPRALAVWLLYHHGEHDQLLALDIEPKHYLNGQCFRDDYTATLFLSKAVFLNTSFDKKKKAFEKFEEFESLCGRTNRRFQNPSFDPLNNGSNVWLLNATKRKIQQILGDFNGDELVDNANWGPGVSTLLKGEEVSGYNKFRAERGVTRDLYALIGDWFPVAYPLWNDHLSREYGESWALPQVGNKIVTVPKNSKTDRVIAVEPGINLWFQKAVGSMIRRRLSRFGIDLNSQLRNATLARFSSKEGDLATVDFSSASDSIASSVVEELLPPRWFQLLNAMRSKIGIDSSGSVRRWNKFSSMGNGYTFELESLIFYAAALATCEYQGQENPIISVFGDDVILPAKSIELFSSYCDYLGFRINKEKSFWDGLFRESCGSHYFDGVDCKPIFLKERLSNAESVYKLANNIRLLAHRRGHCDFCDSKLLGAWSNLVNRVPEPLRLKVPISAGDVGIISNFDEACPERARYGIEGYFYSSLASVGVTRTGDGQGLLLAQLWRLGKSIEPIDYGGQRFEDVKRRVQRTPREFHDYLLRPDLIASGESYTLRGRVRRVVSRTLVSRWYDLGPWL